MANQVTNFIAQSGTLPNVYDPITFSILTTSGSINARNVSITGGTTFSVSLLNAGQKVTITNNSINNITITSTVLIGDSNSFQLKNKETLDLLSDGSNWLII